MRLVQFVDAREIRLGALVGDSIIDLRRAAFAAGHDPEPFRSVNTLLQAGPKKLKLASTLTAANGTPPIPLARTELVAPLAPGKIIAIGLNYRDHALETGMKIPEQPICFAKFTSSVAGPYHDIVLPAVDAQVDFEGELGVVIGQEARCISESEALRHVGGYVCFNDVSARKWQFDDGQWTRGKSCDTFAPFGPCLVTADEIPDPGELNIATRVNGETLQNSNTDQLIFGVARLIAWLSQSFTLQVGDLIATGTPAGVGVFRDPQRFLQAGDVVEVEIEKIGVIRNRVVAASVEGKADCA
jgi:2-keto-4-pentenoate hydratase/2-oxohepta-3-ene-1,7-dioic acid hydratase in catechol pathway